MDGNTDSGFLTVPADDGGTGESKKWVFHSSEGEGWWHNDDSIGLPGVRDSGIVLNSDQIVF